MTDRIPPQAIQAEQSVLGSMLQNQEALSLGVKLLTPEHFYVPKNRKIFGVVCDLYRRGDAVDLLTVPDELASRGQLEEIGGRKYLFDLTDTVVNFANIEDHARLITEAATKNALINFSSEIINLGYDPDIKSADMINYMRSAIERASAMQLSTLPIRMAKDMVETLYAAVESAKTVGITGLRTGFLELDRLILGLQKGYFIVLGGRPSQGKTAFALEIASHISVSEKNPVLFISLEMGELSLAQRLAVTLGGVSSYRLRRGNLRDNEFIELSRFGGMFAEAPFYLADRRVNNLRQIENLCCRAVDELGVKAIFLDYLGLVRHHGRTRENEVAEISQTLKGIAYENDVPLIALAQLSRAAEGVIPQINHLKDSGAIEADSDQVIFIYRPKDREGQLTPEGKIIVAKARNERPGIIDFRFEGSRMRFTMIDKIHKNEEEE